MPSPARPAQLPRVRSAWWALAVAVAAVFGYLNTLHLPFVFDDQAGVIDNATIRDLRAVGTVLSPPANGTGVTGRPLVNASLALDYAMSGLAPWSYHATNLAIHLGAALALFGIVRRTLQRGAAGRAQAAFAAPLAALVAGLWSVHPLQTESVTCVIQRTESLMGLLLLVALYAFIRALDRPAWGWLAVFACAAGMATKEVMVVAPVLLLLYDRTFVTGGFVAALRARRALYAGLAATWQILALLVIGQHGTRGNTEAGAVVPTMLVYAATQGGAIVRYLWLSLWPHPLVLDYGTNLATSAAACAVPCVIIAALLVLGYVAVRQNRPAGFLAAWFFCILAPSSSFIPLLPQPVAEHRMYLPLAALASLAVLAGYRALGRRVLLPLTLIAAAALALTIRRNDDYRSVEGVWRDTIAKVPANPRAYYNLGCAIGAHDYPAAIRAYERAVALEPGYAQAHNNLGQALGAVGNHSRAIVELHTALELRPSLFDVRANLGIQLVLTGHPDRALPLLQSAVAERPNDAQSHGWLGTALLHRGDLAGAISEFETAVRLKPDYFEIENDLGAAWLMRGAPAEAEPHFRRAIALQPGFADAHANLALALRALGHVREAEAEERAAEAARRGAPSR